MVRMIGQLAQWKLEAALEEVVAFAEDYPDATEWEEVDKIITHKFGHAYGSFLPNPSPGLIRFMIKYEQS